MLSRNERVKLVHDEVKKKWPDIWLSFMMKHESKLDWAELSMNPNLTLDTIKTNPDKPWDWYFISRNPNITLAFINANPDKPWHWYWISRNPFNQAKQDYIIQEYRRHLASYRIQQHWHRIRSDPRHPVGMKRLEREYAELFGLEVL